MQGANRRRTAAAARAAQAGPSHADSDSEVSCPSVVYRKQAPIPPDSMQLFASACLWTPADLFCMEAKL